MIGRITSTHPSELTKREPRGTSLAQRKKAAADFKTLLDKELKQTDRGRKMS
ncbi:hypothetical protein [Azotosporobacter soli]|uniref:hypothetical protein n=1 Tax=Azotosporobacter soli TaxID=3055040 RepID=UPI0031FF0F66